MKAKLKFSFVRHLIVLVSLFNLSPIIIRAQDLTINDIAWNPDGTMIAIANSDGNIYVQDPTGSIVLTIPAHQNDIPSLNGAWQVDWSPDGTKIISGGFDKSPKIWDAITGFNIAILPEYSGPVTHVKWSPRGDYVATLGTTEVDTFKIWRTDNWQLAASPQIGTMLDFEWSPNGQFLGLTGYGDVILVFEAPSFDLIALNQDHLNTGRSITWLDNNTLVSSDVTGVVRSWSPILSNTSTTIANLGISIQELEYSVDKSLLAVGLDNGIIHVLDTINNQIVKTYNENNPEDERFWYPSLEWNPQFDNLAFTNLETTGGETITFVDEDEILDISPPPPLPTGTFDMRAQISGPDDNQQSQFRYLLTNTSDTAQSDLSVRLYFSDPNGMSYALDEHYDSSNALTITGPNQLSGDLHYFTLDYGMSAPAAGVWRLGTGCSLPRCAALASRTQ